jgi:hypothetical protein
MVNEFHFTVVDGTQPVQLQQKAVRSIIKKQLQGWEGLPTPGEAVRRDARQRKAQAQGGQSEHQEEPS